MTDWIDDAVDFAGGLVDKVEDSVAHTAAAVEASIDTDKDGSLLDDIGGTMAGLAGDIPIVGGVLENIAKPIAEDLGDFATDTMGTRSQGIFTEKGTLDVENTTDPDYKGDGTFDGVGTYLNKELGIGENDPATLLEVGGAALATMGNPAGLTYAAIGALGDAVKDEPDPFVESGDTQPVE
jgi:hypothetical protein